MTPEQIFKSLKGTWRVVRILGEYGKIEGKATFKYGDGENILFYREDFNEDTMHSYKEYEYRYIDSEIVKYFSDETLFHKLTFVSANIAVGTHNCNQDIYQATYTFHNPASFTLEYSVKGPAKNYIIKSDFYLIS